MHPGKIAHLWIMHKNYASLALEVVVDKYLMFFSTSPGWQNGEKLIPFSSQSPPNNVAIFECILCTFNAHS